jgi:hypothetical protein
MPNIYLNSYRPLVRNKAGLAAAEKYNIPPFVDDSCRREPDFESQFPAIAALCRGSVFAPKLQEGDTVIYLTHKGRYLNMNYDAWRLTAVLTVLKRFESHHEASSWYIERNLPLPRNCWIKGNLSVPIEHTAQPRRKLQVWDGEYRRRARTNGVLLVCEVKHRDLETPPIVTEDMLIEVFGRVPGTRNPPRVTNEQYEKLLQLTKIR